MRQRYYRLQSQAARQSPRFGWFGLVFLVAGVISHRFGWIETFDLFMFALLSAVLALIALTLAIKGFAALWQYGHKGGVAAFKGGSLAVITLVPLTFSAVAWAVFPPLNEVSTDLETPPAFLSGVRPADALPVSDNLVAQAEKQLAAWPQLGSRRYDGSPDNILKAVLLVIKAENWTVAGQKGETGEDTELLVQAVARTLIMGFVSDVVIRLADEGDTTFVDIRAASRYLRRDFGTDARLAMKFMDALDAEVLLTPADRTEE